MYKICIFNTSEIKFYFTYNDHACMHACRAQNNGVVFQSILSYFACMHHVKRAREWVDIKVRLSDPKPKDDMIEIFRKIRSMRMKPAHEVDEDIFEQEYFKKQRESIKEAYSAIRTLRLIFANHPKTKNYEIPEWLYKGEIWTF